MSSRILIAVAGLALAIAAVLAILNQGSRQASVAVAAPVVIADPVTETRVRYPLGREPTLVTPDGVRRTIRSVLNIDRTMRYGDFVWDEAGAPEGPVWVRVDLDAQLVSVFRADHEIGSAVILYGAESKPTPKGAFTVLQKAEHYHSRTYDAPMPYMLRLTADGVAIHASNVREGWATHGCIGVPAEFARRLFALMKLGDPVMITSKV